MTSLRELEQADQADSFRPFPIRAPGLVRCEMCLSEVKPLEFHDGSSRCPQTVGIRGPRAHHVHWKCSACGFSYTTRTAQADGREADRQ